MNENVTKEIWNQIIVQLKGKQKNINNYEFCSTYFILVDGWTVDDFEVCLFGTN